MGYDPRTRELLVGPGSPLNPISNANAIVPAAMTGLSPWWRTETDPVNAQPGHWIWIPDTSTPGPTETVVYEELFSGGNGSFVPESNASSISQTFERDATGELSWLTTITGSSRVKGPMFPIAAVQHKIVVDVGHNDTVPRLFNVQMYETDSGGGYMNFLGAASTSIPNTGLTTFETLITPTMLPVNSVTPTGLRFLVEAQDMTSQSKAYLARVRITK